jgi:hypothetical protein
VIRVRAYLAVLSALAAVAATVALPAPASAAPLGNIKLSESSGTVDKNPIFGTATAAKPCPSGFGSDAAVRIGPPGGPYQNVAVPLRAGGYDKKPVSVKPNRSFARAIGGTPADGEWWVVVECWSLVQGRHPQLFITPLTVTGKSWKVGQPAGGVSLDSTPSPRAAVPTNGPVSGAPAPSASAGGATTAPPSAAPSATVDPALASNNRTGPSSPLASVMWVGGVILVLAIVGAIALLTRRRRVR